MISDNSFEELKNIFKDYMGIEQRIESLKDYLYYEKPTIDCLLYTTMKNRIDILTEELSREKEKMMRVITIQAEKISQTIIINREDIPLSNKPHPEFKVGDKFIITNNIDSEEYEVGEILTLRENLVDTNWGTFTSGDGSSKDCHWWRLLHI
jgi:hypothetical protein